MEAKAKPKRKTPVKARQTLKSESKRAGRPRAVIDWDTVDYYLNAGCSGAGIAGMIGVHPETLYEACTRDNKVGFSEYSRQKKTMGDDMILAQQFDVAMKGEKTMLMYLGKVRLGQRDTPPPDDTPDSNKVHFTIIEEFIQNGKENSKDDEACQSEDDERPGTGADSGLV